MSDVKSVKINDDARDVKDALAREHIGNVTELHTSNKSTLVDAINEVFDNDSDDDGKIGNLSNLMTDSKSNLVSAVNEVYQSADDANDAVGDLSNLNTQNKGNIVGAVNELVGEINDTNDDVTALTTRVGANEGKIGDLSNLHTTDKDNLVEAINETLDSVGDIGDVNLPDLTNIQNTVDAINGVIAQTNSDLTTLTNRVQNDEGDIAQNASDIDSLNTTVGGFNGRIGDLESAVGDIEDVTDSGYSDLSDAVKQITDDLRSADDNISYVNTKLGTNSDLSEPYANEIAANKNHIGDWSQLNVNGRHLVDVCNNLATQIGTLSNLSTTDKTSLVAAINEVAQSGGGSGGSGGSGSALVKVAEYTTQANVGFTAALNSLASLISSIDPTDIYILDAIYPNITDRYYSTAVSSTKIYFERIINYGDNSGNKVDTITLNSTGSYASTSASNNFTEQAVTFNVNSGVKFVLYKLSVSGSSGGSGGDEWELVKEYTSNQNALYFRNLIHNLISGVTFDWDYEYKIVMQRNGSARYIFRQIGLMIDGCIGNFEGAMDYSTQPSRATIAWYNYDNTPSTIYVYNGNTDVSNTGSGNANSTWCKLYRKKIINNL